MVKISKDIYYKVPHKPKKWCDVVLSVPQQNWCRSSLFLWWAPTHTEGHSTLGRASEGRVHLYLLGCFGKWGQFLWVEMDHFRMPFCMNIISSCRLSYLLMHFFHINIIHILSSVKWLRSSLCLHTHVIKVDCTLLSSIFFWLCILCIEWFPVSFTIYEFAT